jgi:hypothetical protein
VAVRSHGHVVRRHGHVVYKVVRSTHTAPAAPLIMPTTMVGQNGARATQNTVISVAGCTPPPAKIEFGHLTVKGNTVVVPLTLTAKATVTVKGKGLKTVRKTLGAGKHTLDVKLTRAGVAMKRHHRTVTLTVSVKFAHKTVTKHPAVKL